MTMEEIANNIKNGRQTHTPVLIAIEGYGGAGKTTFANKLAALLGDTYIIGIDDFIVKEKLTEPSWDRGGFDRDRLEEQVLKPVKAGKRVKYQKLTWVDNSLSDYIELPDAHYVIVEGISSYHPNIAHYYDYKIWIDTPIATAKERGYVRDASNENAQHWDLWMENDLRYQEKYHPELEANFVFNNKAPQ